MKNNNLSFISEDHIQKLKEKADSGNLTAIQTLQKIERQARLEAAKEELMGQAMFDKPGNKNMEESKGLKAMPTVHDISNKMNELDITEIERYIQKGEFRRLPEHMAVYLNWMQEAHDWYYKFKSRTWVVRYLIANCKDKDENPISYYMANKVFNDMLSFFYADKDFKKNSWFRYLAERIEMAAALALEDNDYDTFGKNMERAAKVAALVTVEKQQIDPRLLDRRPRFFLTSNKDLGIPKIDRYKLARQIDEMPLTEREKTAAKQDLGTEERDFGKITEADTDES